MPSRNEDDRSAIGGFAFLPDGMTREQRNIRALGLIIGRARLAAQQAQSAADLAQAVLIELDEEYAAKIAAVEYGADAAAHSLLGMPENG